VTRWLSALIAGPALARAREQIADLTAELARLRPYDRDDAHPAPGDPRPPLPAGVEGFDPHGQLPMRITSLLAGLPPLPGTWPSYRVDDPAGLGGGS
jgi:hypothetical protein